MSVTFNAETFRSRAGKPASPNQYFVTLSGNPKILGSQVDSFKLSMAAHVAELPARQMDVLERRYNGPVRNVPTGHTYATMNIEFLENSDYNIRNYFNLWQNEIFKETEAWKVPFYKDIIADYLDIDLYGPDGRKMSTYRIFEVFPIAISSTNLGWALNNQAMPTNIEFAYHRWEEMNFVKEPKAGAAQEKPLSTFGQLAKKFGQFVKTVKQIKSNADFAKKSVQDVRNLAREIKNFKVNTSSLGGFVGSLDALQNLSNSTNRRINNFGSGVQKVKTTSSEIFNKFGN